MSDHDLAIAETAERASRFLFDKTGKLRGHDWHLAELTLHTILRPATVAEKLAVKSGDSLIDWTATVAEKLAVKSGDSLIDWTALYTSTTLPWPLSYSKMP